MTTINKEEIQKFSNLADQWWDPKGKFKPLHMFNPIRIEYITEKVKDHFKLESKNRALKGLEIFDIGCGGGLMSEPVSSWEVMLLVSMLQKKISKLLKFIQKKID